MVQWPMIKKAKRTPRNYRGSALTTHHLSDLLDHALVFIDEKYQERPDLIVAAWPEVIGPKLAGMTRALSFVEGELTVAVKNSTLYSLLNQHERPRLLKELRQRFSKVEIKAITFRIA